MRSTICQPSAARRTCPAVRSSSGRDAELRTAVDATVTGTTVARTSGAQKIVCSSKDRWGSWAKADAPPPPERRGHLAIWAGSDHRLKVASIVRIAAKTFPGDVGDFGVL